MTGSGERAVPASGRGAGMVSIIAGTAFFARGATIAGTLLDD